MILKLAWRNVWRNKRRTLITIVTIGFGLSALLFQQSLIKSLQNQIIEKATRSYTAHLQIESNQTTDPKVPDFRVAHPEKVYEVVDKLASVESWAPKVIFTGLASSAITSRGILVVGIDPDKEKRLTIIASYLTDGSYLTKGKDHEVMLGSKLAKELDLKLGEKLVIMVQGSDGSLSAEAFRLAGIFKSGSPVYDGQIAYIPIQAAQRLLVCGDEISVVGVRIKDLDELDAVQKRLSAMLAGEPVSVLTWRESSHEIVSIQKFQDAVLLVVLLIIFAIVALGIFNTLLMSLFERIREFGLMMAFGAKPTYVSTLIMAEAFMLGMLGLLFGLLFGCLFIFYFGKRGIPLPISDAMGYWMPFDSVIFLKFAWREHLISALAALLTSLLSAVFPAVHAARLKPAQALRYY